jgi:uncharacterized tellurite resistance protein B-like protein
MKTEAFQELILKSAVAIIACDGRIDEVEILEIKNMAENEIYFMGYDFEQPLSNFLNNIKQNGVNAINDFLDEVTLANLNENQELLLLEVLIRAIESDERIESNELRFLQMVKSKLKLSEEMLIKKFPKQINYFIDIHNYGIQQDFSLNI